MMAHCPIPQMLSFCTRLARQEVLKNDPSFREAISNKAHLTALFILDLEIEQDDTVSSDGSREVARGNLPANCIRNILISKNKMGEIDDSRFILVDSIETDINFSYKDESDNPQAIEDIHVEVPNYEGALRKLAQEQKEPLSQKPIYTHMTRL